MGGSGDAVSSGGCFMTCPNATAASVTAVRALLSIATSRTAHPNTRHHGVTPAAPPSTPQFSHSDFQLLLRWHNQFSLWPPTAHAPASSFRLLLRLRRNGQRVCLRRRNIRLKAVQGLICKVDVWGWYVRLQQRWTWMIVSSEHRSRVAYRRHVHGTYQSGWQQKIHSPVSFPTSADFYKPTWRPLPSGSILNEASLWPHWSVLVRRNYRGMTLLLLLLSSKLDSPRVDSREGQDICAQCLHRQWARPAACLVDTGSKEAGEWSWPVTSTECRG